MIATMCFACGTFAFAFLIGGNLYEQVVCVPRWRSPDGLRAGRSFTGKRHAGYFFLPLGAMALVALATGTALGWREGASNSYALGATLAVLTALLFTRAFFIPRNRLLFMVDTATRDDANATSLMKQWVAANYVRVAISLVALASAFLTLRTR
jgi:uncharacterized membrane protein